MAHIYAFAGSVSAGASDVAIPPVIGTAEYVQNNRLVLQSDQFLLWAYFQGANLTRVRIDSPSLRTQILPRFPYFKRGTAPGDQPPVNDLAGYGFVLRGREEIAVQTSNNLGTGTEKHYAVICVSGTGVGSPSAPEFWLRATGNTTLTADAWTLVPLTFEQTLPAGRYRIVALIVRSATGIAARVIIPGMGDRPGTLCINNIGDEPNRFLQRHAYGDYGTFDSVALPSLEILASGADTSQEVYLGLRRA
jgi:hypothetical protein